MRFGMPLFPFVPRVPMISPPPISNSKTSISVPEKITDTRKEETEDSPFLEIFGIKLDFDDFLILGILFFLYTEKVDDQMLYIILIILLLS